MNAKYRASLSKGRQQWCVIFPHPLIPDKSTDKPGMRVRRGLGTDNRDEAQRIIDDLNVMLADKDFWPPGARDVASRRFCAKAVSAFYDHDRLRTVVTDSWEKRKIIPLPSDGYSVVQLIGSYGVGKSTLLRQLIGTDPKTERFPSTSKGKTTTCDTEIICAPGEYSAVISFHSRDRVRAYTEECVEAAVSAAAEGLSDNLIARKFLEHSEQRFRLAYVLGKFLDPNQSDNGDDEADDDIDANGHDDAKTSGVVSEQERKENAQKLADWIARCKSVAASVVSAVEDETGESAGELSRNDRDAFLELVDERLQESEALQEIVDEVMEALEQRFAFIEMGTFDKDNSGWPVCWQITIDQRQEFLRQVGHFSGNYEKHFGRLLAPLVDGIRVKGPFKPTGSDQVNPIVLLDGEGLGHVSSTATSVPTAVTRRFDLAHVILLVDTAERAMDSGPKALLRCVVASGHERKLAVVFTHFDQMESDAFGNEQDKQNHVLSSLEQAVISLDETLELDAQTGASRRMRKHLADRVYFVGRINEIIEENAKKTKGTRKALNGLVQLMLEAGRPEAPTIAVPCYDLAYLYPRINKATDTFQRDMNLLLRTEHWKKVEALTRRFAQQWSEDGYGKIFPVAQLSLLLKETLARFWATPKTWKSGSCAQEMKDSAIQKVEREFSWRLDAYLGRRFREDHRNAWVVAYRRGGRGSGRERSNDVRGIDEDVAPVPSEERASKLFDDIRQLCREAIAAAGAEVTVS